MKTLEKKFDYISICSKVCNFGAKICVLLLLFFIFIGYINPARISGKQKTSVSLVKSALYFKGSTADVIDFNIIKEETNEQTEAIASLDAEEADSYDDFYAQFAQLADSTSFAFGDSIDSDDDDDSIYKKKADKIVVKDYKAAWNNFSVANGQIAQIFENNRKASLATFIAVLICLLGVYFSCGKLWIKRTGYIIICAGSVFVALSMLNFTQNYLLFLNDFHSESLFPVKPNGITLYITFAILAFAFSISTLLLDKCENECNTFTAFPFQITYRVLSLLLFVLLFIPGANPSRISENISRNVSLFTAGFSYPTFIENMKLVLIRGWLPESVMRTAWFFSLLTCLGIIACGVGSCMSVGNNKLKRIGHYVLFGGSAVSFASLFGILHAYNVVSSSPNLAKVLPLEPNSIVIYFVLLGLILVSTGISFIKTPAPEKDEKCHIDAPLQLLLMILPFLILVFIFSYLPLWGWRYAFFDYNAGDTLSMDKWVGLKWFKAPFENAATRSDILRVLKNTLAMSGLGILGSWLPMAFAIFLSEIKNMKIRKVIQTLTTVPNFISWVLVYAIAFCIFGTEGFISSLMVNTGVWERGVNMLMGDKAIWIKMWLWGTWKGLGWSAIMYIAAISGIDQQLYEAATVDGANRFQKIWHITVPELFPTYIVLLILSVSNILSNGMDQYLVFKNPTNKNPIEVLDLYVYQLSFGQTVNSNIPFSTVVSMFKSLVSVILLFITNKISKWIRGTSIF